MWEGESPPGNEVGVLSGLHYALLRAEERLVANISPSPEADIFLPCFGARFVPEACSDLWEMPYLLWDLPSFTTSLGQPQWVQTPAVGCAARSKDPWCSRLPWRKHPQELGQKGQVSHQQWLPCQCWQALEAAASGVCREMLTRARSVRHKLCSSTDVASTLPLEGTGERYFLSAGNPEIATLHCTLS